MGASQSAKNNKEMGASQSAYSPVGPASGGPASGGPASGGPASGGPASGGPASGGPASGGPASGGPASGGPASGGPASGGGGSSVGQGTEAREIILRKDGIIARQKRKSKIDGNIVYFSMY